MRSKRIGCINPMGAALGGATAGLPTAREEFFRALLRYGSFDAYDVFCADSESHRRFTERLSQLVPDEAKRRRVEVTLTIALHEAVQERDYTIFHTHDALHTLPALARLRNRCARSPFAISATAGAGQGSQRVGSWLELALGGLQPYDSIATSSSSVGHTMQLQLRHASRLLGDDRVQTPRFDTIPLGVDEALFEPMDKTEAREAFRMNSDWRVGLSVGRISHYHMLDWGPMLEALARMQTQGDLEGALFIIAGGGDPVSVQVLGTMVEQLGLSHRVLIFSNFKPEVRRQLYAAADFFVAPVDHYHAVDDTAVIEAMASGLPVIASDLGAYREWIDSDRNGVLIPTTSWETTPAFLAETQSLLSPAVERLLLAQAVAVDVNALEDEIRSLLDDDQRRSRLGAEARRSATRFAWPKIIAEYESLWTDMATTAARIGRLVAPATQDLAATDVDTAYAHYPSRRLGPDAVVTLNERVAPDSELARYDDVRVCIFEPLECLVMESLFDGEKTVAELRLSAEHTLGVSPGYVDFHVLWLTKHGRVTLQSS